MDARMLFEKAHAAGMAALQACVPTPMTVGTAKGLSNEIDYSKRTYYVPEGVCGFAWIKIRPARGRFVAYCKSINAGHNGYQGGYDIWVREGGQSYERKMAYARAFAAVLKGAGLNAYPEGRLD